MAINLTMSEGQILESFLKIIRSLHKKKNHNGIYNNKFETIINIFFNDSQYFASSFVIKS